MPSQPELACTQVADIALAPLQPILDPLVTLLHPILAPLATLWPYLAALALTLTLARGIARLRARHDAAKRLSHHKRQDLQRVKARFMAALHDDAGSQAWIQAHSPRSVEQLTVAAPPVPLARRCVLPFGTVLYLATAVICSV